MPVRSNWYWTAISGESMLTAMNLVITRGSRTYPRPLAAVVAAAIALLTAVQPADRAAAATTVPGDPLTGSGAVSRSLLTASDLQSLDAPTAAIDNSGFALPAAAAPPAHQLNGRLTLTGEPTRGSFKEIKDTFLYAPNSTNTDHPIKHLPEMDIELVQNGSHLVPTYQGLYATGHAHWNYLVGPGRIWSENGDGGWSRAALPFAIVERNANCTHNGVLSFLYNGSTVSNVRYQVTQETCYYFKFDMWGELPASFTPTVNPAAETVRNDHAAEVAGRMPVKPMSQLTVDRPGTGADVSYFGGANSGVTAAHMTQYGLMIADPTNGNVITSYTGGCDTRFGAYPFCADMRMPSYSTGKTTFAGMAFMRLHQGDPAVKAATIGGHVSEVPTYAQAGHQWNNVTINHTVDMATGHYRSKLDFSDEDSLSEEQFLLSESYTDKVKNALDAWPYKAAPGTQFVYQSHATFLAGRAMQNWAGGGDLFSTMRDEVYLPLGISKGFLSTLRADNTSYNSGALGQAQGSHGLWYNRDDVAKLARLLNNDAGRIGGTQVLSRTEVDAGMQRNPADRGSTPGGSIANQKYNNGIWAKYVTRAEFPSNGYACDFYVPRMSGYGGIVVLMMPNGSTYWYVSDNDEFAWYNAIRESNKLASMCP